LISKYQASIEKVNYYKECVKNCEGVCKKQQEQYYFSDLPVILESLKSKEEERCYNLKKYFIEANKVEKLSVQYIVNINNSVGEGLKDIDVAGDLEDFTQNYMYSFNHDSDISVRSLINPEKAGRMNIHKDTGSMEWKSRYFVLMSKHFRLYCFESEDSIKPKEIIDLNNASIHLLDDSYFNLSNSFQIIIYNNIKEKTRKKAFVYYFVAESHADCQEWFSHIRDVAYCCQTCNITKMILYEYNQKIHGKDGNHCCHNILSQKINKSNEYSYSHNNSRIIDSETASAVTPTSNCNSNILTVNGTEQGQNNSNIVITDQIKKVFDTGQAQEIQVSNKSPKANKSLITFAEALDDPLIFLNSDEDEEYENSIKKSNSSSPTPSQNSLNKIINNKSPVPSQKSLITTNLQEDQSLPLKNAAQRFYEHNKDKKQNRYSTSFIESSRTLNSSNLKRDSSTEINMGNNMKKDSSFFKLIKNNAKNISIFNSGSEESINNILNDPSSGTIQPSKQNCHYSIITNIPHSKMSKYSIPNYVNSSSEEDLNNMFEYLNNKNKYTINRSIKLCILEARNIYSNEKKKNPEFLSYIFFDDIIQAKTSKQVGNNPFWGEEFNFENVLPCLNNIHIFICQQHRVSNEAEVGHVIIPINKLHSNKKVEEWIPLIPLGNYSSNENFNASIRVSITLIDEHILPMEDYSEFIDYVTQPSLEPVIKLGNIVQQREEFAKTLLYILIDKQKEIEGLKTLVSLEIKKTDDPNIIFRGNSLTTKIIDQYMKLVGSRYLSNTLKRQIQNIYNLKESCEVDPSKIDKSEDIKKHWKKLLSYVNNFWEAIRQSLPKCPSKLREIFSFTKTVVSKTFKNENTVQYSSVSGFIFLRFFCPAILSPKLFGLAEQHPDPVTARTLTLIAKILQNLANLTEFASKEPHMKESNIFIKNHINEMKYFIDAISIMPDKEEENAPIDYEIRSQCEKFYRFYRSNCKQCFSIKNPDDKKMLNIIQNISNIHIKYRENLLNYQISSEDKSIRKVLNNSEASLYDIINGEGKEVKEEEENKEPEIYSSHIKKELSNFVMDECIKNEMDDCLKNIIFTIRRFSAQYNKKDGTTKKQYNTINKMTINQYTPYIEELFSPNQKTSYLLTTNNNNDKDECDSKSVYSAHSLMELNTIGNNKSKANSLMELNVSFPNNNNNNKSNATSLMELNISTNKLESNSHNSINSNSSISVHSNNSYNTNNQLSPEGYDENSKDEDDDDDDEIISLTEGLNLLNDQPYNSSDRKNKYSDSVTSRHNSLRNNNGNHFIKIFTNGKEDGNSNNCSSSNNSPTANLSPVDSYYTITSGGGEDNFQSGQYSPNSKKRFPLNPLNMKRKFSMTINSLTGGSHSGNVHRDHGKVTRDF